MNTGNLTQENIMNLAHKARIKITPKEADKYKDMSKIFDLISQIEAVDTKGILPMVHPLDFDQRLRQDIPIPVENKQALHQIAPEMEADIYLVPELFED